MNIAKKPKSDVILNQQIFKLEQQNISSQKKLLAQENKILKQENKILKLEQKVIHLETENRESDDKRLMQIAVEVLTKKEHGESLKKEHDAPPNKLLMK